MRTAVLRAPCLLPLLLLLCLPALAGFAQELYWEDPRLLVPSGVRYPVALSTARAVVALWQETTASGTGGGSVWLSLAAGEDGRTWRQTRRFAGPFEFLEQEAPIFDAAVDRLGRIVVAVTGERDTVQVLVSSDLGRSFQPAGTVRASGGDDPGARVGVLAAPQLSVTGEGSWLLFVTQERGGFLNTWYALRPGGGEWGPLAPLVSSGGSGLDIALLPHHASFRGKEHVVFQAARAGGATSKASFGLYLKTSADGGRTWGAEVPLAFTSRPDTSNQRPNLAALDGRLGLAWESATGAQPLQLYYAEMDESGRPVEDPAPLRGGGTGWDNLDKYDPRVFEYRGRLYVTGFDRNNQVFLAERRGTRWTIRQPKLAGSSLFIQPVLQADRLYLFWENRRGAVSGLAIQEPDQSVDPPLLTAVNFDPRSAGRQRTVRIRWAEPYDSSFIAGYRFAWSTDPEAPLDNVLNRSQPTQELSLEAPEDGTWHFRLAAEDNARNLSRPAALRYERDTVPPAPVTLLPPETGPDGFAVSNSPRLAWEPQPGERLAGYAWTLRLLREDPRGDPGSVRVTVPASAPLVSRASASWANLDNGLYAFAVVAVDQAGNASEPATLLLRLDRFVASTRLGEVRIGRDLLGRPSGLRIPGRGFLEDGRVTQVFLDRDGEPPYDHVFRPGDGRTEVPNDRLIEVSRLPVLQEGDYRVGVVHPVRGVVLSGPVVRQGRTGTIKIGDFSAAVERPSWKSAGRARTLVRIDEVAVWLIVGLLGLLALVTARKLVVLAQESRLVRTELFAILNGTAVRKETRMREIRRRGTSLRTKFIFLTVLLVVLIVAMVSVRLYFYMRVNQIEKGAVSLYEKASVMLGSLSAAAANGLDLPERTPVEKFDKQSALSVAAGQIGAMEEAEFATITGSRAGDATRFDYVWAGLHRRENGTLGEGLAGGGTFVPGESLLPDEGTLPWIPVSFDGPWGEYGREQPFAGTIAALTEQLTVRTNERISTDLEERQRIQERARALDPQDPLFSEKSAGLSRQNTALRTRINEEIRRVGQIIGTDTVYPYLSEGSRGELRERYTFYMPIVYLRGEGDYYQGMVRLGVTTAKIQAEIAEATRQIFSQIGLVALLAALLGLVGAFIMAAITVSPIRKLARGVEKIRDTEDKEKLKDHVIVVRSRDEIGLLAQTVNEMTQGLVKAALANRDLIFGKEVQKMFLPLQADGVGRKGSTAALEDGHVELFGFYEGAKGVSGDYFDYIRLDGRHLAFIKCDVAGKGIPAALIMVEVATIFAGYFRGWTPKSPGLHLDSLVYRINDMLEERGFKGRFAALTVGILDTHSGAGWFCNAGDNSLRLYSRQAARLQEVKLPSAPAAGVFPSEMVQLQSGFQQVSNRLNPGDTLFLYTDGIEEANRQFRDAQFQVTTCREPGLAEKDSHGGTHVLGAQTEEFGAARIAEITAAVYGRGRYRLRRFHTPLPDEELTFDFTSCQGSVKEAVLALISVEKVFRLVPDPSAGEGDRISVDRQVDEFLQAHFEQYGVLFAHPVEGPDAAARLFCRLKEDEQYDDLTILAIRKK